jgi:hypothetical protein
MSILDHLGQRHNTNKASVWNGKPQVIDGHLHRYLPFYQSFFAPLRDEEITFLEIGVERGCSLMMWRDYFQRGKIVGMDCALVSQFTDRIVIENGDQCKPEDLDRIAAKHGPFDVILDDAGHVTEAQIFCYDYMIPHVKPGGFYVLEDIMDRKVTDHLCKIASNLVLTQIARIESIAFSYGTTVTKIRK